MTNESNQYPSYRWLILIVAALSYINVQIANLSITPILPHIAQDLGVDLGVATNFMTVFLFSGNIILLAVGGAICDRFGILNTLAVGLLCAIIPSTLMPWVGETYTGVFYARLIQGLSPGFIFPAMGPILAIWFPLEEKGLATGLMSAGVALGSFLGIMGGPIVFKMVDTWQQMTAWVSIIGWIDLAFIIFLIALPKPQSPVQHSEDAAQPDKNIFKVALLAPLTIVGIFLTFMASWNMQCLYSLTPTFLSADIPTGAGYGPMMSGQLMINVTVISGIFGPMVLGLLVDKVFKGNTKEVFAIGFILMCVFMYAIKTPFIYGSKVPLSISLMLAGLGVQFVMPAIYIFMAKSYKHQIVGKMTGLWMGLGTFGGVLGLYLAGKTLTIAGNYSIAFTLMSLAALVGLVLSFVMSKLKTLND
ncbi:MFS transporter [Deltaproteobacteria bacterium]|nr:MFS transporter [Deltaproteobacteria bacterium]